MWKANSGREGGGGDERQRGAKKASLRRFAPTARVLGSLFVGVVFRSVLMAGLPLEVQFMREC